MTDVAMGEARSLSRAAADRDIELAGLRDTVAEMQALGDREATIGRLMHEIVQLRLREADHARAAEDARSAVDKAQLARVRYALLLLHCGVLWLCFTLLFCVLEPRS